MLRFIESIVYYFAFFIVSTVYPSEKDSIVVKGKFVFNKSVTSIALCAYTNDKPIKEESVVEQKFEFVVPATIEPGVYYLKYVNGRESNIDVIISGKEKIIELELVPGNYKNYPKVIESFENSLWYNYLKGSQPKIERLQSLFQHFSNFQEQIFNKQIVNVYQKERRNYYKNWERFISDNKNSLTGKLVMNEPYYFSDLSKDPIKRDFLRRDYFWEGIDTNNPDLINGPLYRRLILSYFEYVENNSIHHPFTNEEKIYEYKKSIVVVLNKFSKNFKTKEFAIKYLMQLDAINTNTELINYVTNYKE
jgi:hypothetical protein